jgi:anionic cell wall polymer biosynthesis LytR-Cps2A-Psr (LCP) family protein
MGILTLIVVAVVVLAVIGLGVGTFYSGVLNGAEKVGDNSVVEDAAAKAKELADNAAKTVEDTIASKP